jgi:hypothetical protein
MDVAGNLATVDQTLVIDTVATAKPVIGFATGEDMYVNATETGASLLLTLNYPHSHQMPKCQNQVPH